MALDLEPTVTLPWLVRLRWLFFLGQLVAVPIAKWGGGAELVWAPLLAAIVIYGLSNALVTPLMTRYGWPAGRVLGGLLLLDALLLTVLLASAGAASNPFTLLYLVNITLSAVVLSARWTVAIAALSIAGFGALFAVPSGEGVEMDMSMPMHGGFGHHLQGMWAAFVLAAGLTAFFVRRVALAIGAQREQIAALREAAERNSRLAALTTLAAGAAHELNSPLATIAVAAHEARLRAQDPSVAADLELIQQEVDRCQAILHQMAARAGHESDVAALKLVDLADRIRDHLGDERSKRVDVELRGDAHAISLPSAQTVQSVVALIKNALDASPAQSRVSVAVACEPAGVQIAIADHGTGISQEVLSKVGEPFFTTKQPGAGMGLGVFLARAFVQSLGGKLEIESTLGIGTRVVVMIPTAEASA